MKPIEYQDKTKKFHKPGTERLTYYEFRCGYVQQIHVRAHDFGKHERLFWDSFDTMTQANARYFKAKRELGLGKQTEPALSPVEQEAFQRSGK